MIHNIIHFKSYDSGEAGAMNPRPPQSAGYFGHTSFFDRNSPLNLENLPNSLLQKLKRLKDDKNVLKKVSLGIYLL